MAALLRQSTLDGHPGNVILVAAHRPLDADALSALVAPAGYVVLGPRTLAELVGDSMVLRDDFAPVDQLITRR